MRTQEIQALLPHVFRRAITGGSPTAALLAVMEQLHEPAEQRLLRITEVFDPWRTPVEFLPLLAEWVGLGWLWRSDNVLRQQPGRARALLAGAAELARRQGTAAGLTAFLRLATGLLDLRVTVDEHRPFHFRVEAPAAGQPLRAFLTRIIEHERPMHSTWELHFVNATE